MQSEPWIFKPEVDIVYITKPKSYTFLAVPRSISSQFFFRALLVRVILAYGA
eukprot:m.13557 g.13557  ORF g.13557 m.13557 type:complete len:52 (+) comp7316_c0_seq1:452-607(+)